MQTFARNSTLDSHLRTNDIIIELKLRFIGIALFVCIREIERQKFKRRVLNAGLRRGQRIAPRHLRNCT